MSKSLIVVLLTASLCAMSVSQSVPKFDNNCVTYCDPPARLILNSKTTPVVDGCGSNSSGIVKIIIDALTYLVDFKPSCDKHDLCYDDCTRTKGTCDDNFKTDMNAQCDKMKPLWIPVNKWYCRKQASLFYIAVHEDGCDAYKKAQTRRCICTTATTAKPAPTQKTTSGPTNPKKPTLTPTPKSPAGPVACQCVTYDCSCCTHLDVSAISLHETGCVNISYQPSTRVITDALTVGGISLGRVTISAKNVPNTCVTYKGAKVCPHFDNLTVANNALSGCISLKFTVVFVNVSIPIKCFTIHLANQDEVIAVQAIVATMKLAGLAK